LLAAAAIPLAWRSSCINSDTPKFSTQAKGAMHMTILSATTLTGDSVKNRAGEDLGNIEDFMLDVDQGDVQYAVLSFGGFMGMGDKLFAVPMKAMTLNRDDKCFVLDVNKEQLKDAPGFDKHNWPNWADPEFRTSIASYYGTG
jgi:sporulation protein YlmC with PRC-barrel domain